MKHPFPHVDLRKGALMAGIIGLLLLLRSQFSLCLVKGESMLPALQSGDLLVVEPGWLNLRRGRLLDGRYALLGDNRSLPTSVSVHAIVAKDQIVGKVVHSLQPRQAGGLQSAKGLCKN